MGFYEHHAILTVEVHPKKTIFTRIEFVITQFLYLLLRSQMHK